MMWGMGRKWCGKQQLSLMEDWEEGRQKSFQASWCCCSWIPLESAFSKRPLPQHLGKVTFHDKQTKERNFLGNGTHTECKRSFLLSLIKEYGARISTAELAFKSLPNPNSSWSGCVNICICLPPSLWVPRAGFHTKQWQCEELCLNLL